MNAPLPRSAAPPLLQPPATQDELQHALTLIQSALRSAAPGSPEQQHLAEAQRTLVEMIWRAAVA